MSRTSFVPSIPRFDNEAKRLSKEHDMPMHRARDLVASRYGFGSYQDYQDALHPQGNVAIMDTDIEQEM